MATVYVFDEANARYEGMEKTDIQDALEAVEAEIPTITYGTSLPSSSTGAEGDIFLLISG